MPVLADAPRRWIDLRLRVLSAAVLAPAVLACVWFGGIAFLILMLGATLGLCLEWSRLHRWRDTAPATLLLIATACGSVLAAGLDQGVMALAVLAIGGLTLALVLPSGGPATGFLGLPYVAAGAAALTWLRADPEVGREEVFFLLLLVWASDIGAYITGRLVGGPRLAPSVSPNKTWSGAIGGLCTAVGVALAICFVIKAPGSIVVSALMAASLGVVAQAGDLFESAIKRRVGAKDSGHLIPGHGGLLDRLDALLAAAPVAVLLALAAGRGVIFWE